MLHSIQALRAIAAAGVAYYHCVVWLHQSLGVSFPNTAYTAGLGAAGVHIFFVVSGFIMMWTNQDNSGNWSRFLRKRFSRIYPSYWLVALIGIPFAILVDRDLPHQPEIWLGAILLLPKGASALVDVGWTLAFEVYFYCVFAVLIALRVSLLRRVIWLGALFAISIAIGVLWKPASESMFGLPKMMTNGLLLEFAAGALLGWAAARSFSAPAWLGALLVAGAILGFGLSVVVGYDLYPAVALWGLPSILLVAGVVILERHKWCLELFNMLSPLGDSSYALYLIHAILVPVIVFFAPAYSDLSYPVFMALVGLLLAFNLAIAHVYFQKIETNLIRASNDLLSRISESREKS